MTRAGRTAVALPVAALILMGAGVLRPAPVRAPAGPARAPAATAPPQPRGSIYDLGLRVRDADGIERGLDDLRGHPVLASMFYASCTSACPLLVSNMKRVAAGAPSGLRDDLRVLLVSFDPARDPPAALADVARRHDLDVGRWRIAVAPDEATARALAAVLGIRYRATADGMIDHTTAITVLDPAGGVRGRAEDPSAVAALLARLTGGTGS
ncbi:MAG TPA: SCO family protein [Polyangia bacterium]|nr:SCO family protein [Polyangia bacterium]